MFNKLEKIKNRYGELEKLIQSPDVIQDASLYKKYAKELAKIRKLASQYNEYLKLKSEIEDLEKELNEKKHENEFMAMIDDELKTLKERFKKMDLELEEELFESEDEDSGKNIIMEIRSGTGGTEAALFVSDLSRMYQRFAASKSWTCETISSSSTEKGGTKEVIFSIKGSHVYSIMKYESGTHRVQRVPETEASGRIHTSAATVAVLPEAEDVDLTINPQDLKIDVFRAGGRGGQHVNVTDSAVRITHIPSGLVVSCQDERSQHKNKAKGMRVLRSRLYEKIKSDRHKKISAERKTQVGSGDRSEKIRTYNFPDGRVTDHRIGLTLYKLDQILNGDLNEIVAGLKEAERKIRRGAA